MNKEGIGMCHQCFTTGIKVEIYNGGDVLCGSCIAKKFHPKSKQSFQNIPEPTIENLKRKFERDYS